MSYGDLTSHEIQLSKLVSKRLGFSVLMYRDGQWICQPRDSRLNGYGASAEEAEKDCMERNKVNGYNQARN